MEIDKGTKTKSKLEWQRGRRQSIGSENVTERGRKWERDVDRDRVTERERKREREGSRVSCC